MGEISLMDSLSLQIAKQIFRAEAVPGKRDITRWMRPLRTISGERLLHGNHAVVAAGGESAEYSWWSSPLRMRGCGWPLDAYEQFDDRVAAASLARHQLLRDHSQQGERQLLADLQLITLRK